jgi:hypothetical protein
MHNITRVQALECDANFYNETQFFSLKKRKKEKKREKYTQLNDQQFTSK